ncbi:MAG TPA: peptidoglycan DD-metalloendopeptidase family protein, partial [Methylophilus sp.]
MLRTFFISLLSLYIASCSSNPPAPVVDKIVPPKPVVKAKPAASADWRPSSYTVKKGDTLFAIGLEFGYDYKEIAEANNIKAPYQINIGQKLILPNVAEAADKIVAEPNENGVVVTPITTESVITEVKPDAAPNTAEKTQPTLISQPKALREVYSLEALNRPITSEASQVAKTPPTTVATTAPSTTPTTANASKPVSTAKPLTDEGISWTWPTKGKVVSGFNESANKGIDIAGTAGQAVLAASGGKVIYSGSDLRGYGKLIIIKHNKTFLSVYAHNSKILVKEGQLVSSGQKIAEM